MKMNRGVRLGALLAVVGLAAAACGEQSSDRTPERAAGPAEAAITIEVHRSPTCECCGAYEGYLEDQGFVVQSMEHDDMAAVKRSLGVPDEMASCHTSVVDRYFVEGHVPAEVIRDLLAQRPDVDGISLPGMPPGSPGMGGAKTEPFVIWAIEEGRAQEYAQV